MATHSSVLAWRISGTAFCEVSQSRIRLKPLSSSSSSSRATDTREIRKCVPYCYLCPEEEEGKGGEEDAGFIRDSFWFH